MKNLVQTMKFIEEQEIELEEIYSKARSVEKTIDKAKKELQEKCEHPEQFREKIITKGRDPLEADRYTIYCHICNKKLDGGNIW